MAPWPAPIMAATFTTNLYVTQTANTIYETYAPIVYSGAYDRRDQVYVDDVALDPRRWMRGSFPPPVEIELAALPPSPPAPPAEAAWTREASGRVIARVRRRRPIRGRAGRPHEASA